MTGQYILYYFVWYVLIILHDFSFVFYFPGKYSNKINLYLNWNDCILCLFLTFNNWQLSSLHLLFLFWFYFFCVNSIIHLYIYIIYYQPKCFVLFFNFVFFFLVLQSNEIIYIDIYIYIHLRWCESRTVHYLKKKIYKKGTYINYLLRK